MASYFMLNKPSGCVTARKDERFKTVMDFFPEDKRFVYHPVGRLDKDTEGLLIITDDGKLDEFLLRPERNIEKKYFFWALGEPDSDKLHNIEAGVLLKGNGGVTRPAKTEVFDISRICDIEEFLSPDHRDKLMKNPSASVFSGEITITEGKRHEVKRIFSTQQYAVVYLKRISIGGLILPENLDKGLYIELSEEELASTGYVIT